MDTDQRVRHDLALRARVDPDAEALVRRLYTVALRGLPTMYRTETDELVFTRAARGDGTTEPRGTSTRYAAIVALGAHRLPPAAQRPLLGGRTVADLVGLLLDRLSRTTNLGDAALVCWAAALERPDRLPEALARLRDLDVFARPQYVVEAAWVVSALTAARHHADVEEHLALARNRLLASRFSGSPLFPHATGSGLLPWYRLHVACYADQVYPIQALALLHASGDDPQALRVATECADRICAAQGPGGQWWWHYDARTGRVVEGYPVYTVHQHAMGPMALLDLAEAGGPDYRVPIERGLRWITDPAELHGGGEPLVRDDDGLTWRKIYRGDPKKVVRAVRGASTRILPRIRVPALYRPSTVDRECRPYELGWLLYAWLPAPEGTVTR